MNEKELAMERFVATGGDRLIKESQCKRCTNNNVMECRIFGEFPWKYRSSEYDIACSERIEGDKNGSH